MNCPRCKTRLTDDARFCGICGYALPTPPGNAAPNNTSTVPGDDEATLMASSWSGAQYPPQGSQEHAPYGQTPMGGTPLAHKAPPTMQPGAFQPTQPVNQFPAAYAPGMVPGVLNSSGAVAAPTRQRKRRGKALRRTLLPLLLLLIIATGGWFLGVRPYLHSIAQQQLDQMLTSVETQVSLFQLALPPGSRVVPVTETSINNYLNSHDTAPLQNLHATITPENLRMDFSVYNFSSSILLVPVATGGMLQVTQVQVQGVMQFIMSSDELSTELNSNFQNFSHQMKRSISNVTLREHQLDIQIS